MQMVGADVSHKGIENEKVHVLSSVLHFSLSIQSVQNTHKMDTGDFHDEPVAILLHKRLKTIDLFKVTCFKCLLSWTITSSK